MTQQQYNLLKQYSQSLEVQNNSKLNEINFLVSELNRISEDNRQLNQELNFISQNNNRHAFENHIHELEFALQQKEELIGRLIADNQHLDLMVHELESRGVQNYAINEIREEPVLEDQKTDRMSEETSRRIDQLEASEKQNLEVINSLREKLIEKEMEISELVFEDKAKIKIIEEYLISKHEYEQRIGELGNEYDLLKHTAQSLKQANEKAMALNTSLANQIQDLKKQINEKHNNILKSSQNDQANALLQNMVSELSAEVMYSRMREEEWDRESLSLHAEINRLTKQILLLKTKNMLVTEQHGNNLAGNESYRLSSTYLSPIKTSIARTECESSGSKTEILGTSDVFVNGKLITSKDMDLRSTGYIPAQSSVKIVSYQSLTGRSNHI